MWSNSLPLTGRAERSRQGRFSRKKTHRKRGTPQRRFVPRLETLEDRMLLSILPTSPALADLAAPDLPGPGGGGGDFGPTLSRLSPSFTGAGGPAFQLFVSGRNFFAGATVEWNSTPLATHFLDVRTLRATVPASLIAAVGSDSITVSEFTGTSNALTFNVLPPSPPVANFDWRMPQHFGQDNLTSNYNQQTGNITFTQGPDGMIDYPWEDPTLVTYTVNDPQVGKIDYNNYVHPDKWTVILDASSSQHGSSPISTYTWTIQSITLAPQTSPVLSYAFPSLGTYSVTLTVTAADGSMSIPKTLCVVVKDYLIVSIGESFASGDGAPDKPVQYFGPIPIAPAQWENPRAYRSEFSGPAQAALALQRDLGPHASVTFVSVATSGGKISDGGLLSQIDQLQKLVGDRCIDAMLVSAGGDDVGFGQIAQDLVLGPYLAGIVDGKPPRTLDAIETDFLQNLNNLDNQWYPKLAAAITKQLHPNNVYITQYPDLLRDANGFFSDFPGLFGPTPLNVLSVVSLLDPLLIITPDDLAHALDFGISADKARWAYYNLEVPLNDEVQQAAVRWGWHFVDGIAADFQTHGYAAGDQRWINTFEDSLHYQGDVVGPLHPNAAGYQDIANRIVQQMLSGSIRGEVFDDANANGVIDNGERGLGGWTVYIDKNNHGRLDFGDPTTITDAEGKYSFEGLAPGTYVVREAPQPGNGWIQTKPPSVTVTVGVDFITGQNGTEVDFGNYHPGSIFGRVMNDLDDDGADTTQVTVLSVDTPKTIEDATVFSVGMHGEHFTIPSTTMSRLTVSGPAGSLTNVSLTLTIGQNDQSDLDVVLISPWGQPVRFFHNVSQGTLSASLPDFNNQNPNGDWFLEITDKEPGSGPAILQSWSLTLTMNPQEPGLGGWRVYLDLNNNDVLDSTSVTLPSPDAPKTIEDATIESIGIHGIHFTIPSMTMSRLTVGGLTGLLTNVGLTLTISQNDQSDLDVVLISPWGQPVRFFHNVSQGTLSASVPDFNNQNPNGDWFLEITDGKPGFRSAILQSWSLTLTVGDPSTLTRPDGSYSFQNLRPGYYTIREQIPQGWVRTDSEGDSDTALVQEGQASGSYDFWNFQQSIIGFTASGGVLPAGATLTSSLPTASQNRDVTTPRFEGIWALEPASLDGHLAAFSQAHLSLPVARAAMRSLGLLDNPWREAFGLADFGAEELQ
jgi:subtilisin-like proprotein convertase family protein